MKIRLFLESGQTEDVEVKEEDNDKLFELAKVFEHIIIKDNYTYVSLVDKDNLPCHFCCVTGMRLIL